MLKVLKLQVIKSLRSMKAKLVGSVETNWF